MSSAQSRHRGKEICVDSLVGNCEAGSGWNDNIKMDLEELGWQVMDRNQWRAVVNTINEPTGSIKE
jgi:hypothetical protein